MARYRKIAPSIWNDAKFRDLSDNGKLVFFMLLTHPQTTPVGTLRAYPQGLAPELGWSEKAFREAFREASEKGMVICSERDGLIWLPNFTKYNTPESPNVLKSWAGGFDDCPECELKGKIYEHVRAFAEALGEAFGKAFREAFRLPSPNQEQEQEQEQDNITTLRVVVDAEGDDAPTPTPPAGGIAPCPHREIIAAYHAELPTLAKVKIWEGTRQRNLQARWRSCWERGKYATTADGIDYWRRFFRYVGKCPFLVGEMSTRDGKTWRADLGWLVRPENFAKVIEGKYAEREDA